MIGAARRAARAAARDDWAFASELSSSWRWVAEGTALARTVPCVAGGVVTSVPRVVGVEMGPPVRLTVCLLPGQLPADVADVADRLAEGLSVAVVRVEPSRYHGHVVVTLLPVDPLGDRSARAQGRVRFPTLLGRDEGGRPVLLDWGTASHMIVQGATRSGKSTGLYGVLAQLAHVPHVEVTGCDPTGLLLAPWAKLVADRPQAFFSDQGKRDARSKLEQASIPPSMGTRKPAAHVAVLEALTGEMDTRISGIRDGRDTVDLGPGCPLIVAVLEEYPGLLRVLDGADRKLGQLARAAVARLLSEGAKAGLRVVLVAQRAEANVIGGFERGQASHRISFRVDGPETVKMLHPDVSPEVVAGHSTAPAGVALLTAPGRPLTRLRAPYVPYAGYVDAVQRRAA